MAVDTPARIAILGAGPIGLEAAIYARFLGYDVDIYERGRVCENVLRWGHTPMFTRFGDCRSTLGLAALSAQDDDWTPPADNALLTGREIVEQYYDRLARSDLLVDNLFENTEVAAVGRDGLIKSEHPGEDDVRIDAAFRILLRDQSGAERLATADVVFDTTGTYGQHNWLGEGGVPALGERSAAAEIEYGLPDILGAEREKYAHRHTLVIGNGYCAARTVVALEELARQSPQTTVTWITRKENPSADGPMSISLAHSPQELVQLAQSANRLSGDDCDHVTHWPSTTVEAIQRRSHPASFIVKLIGQPAGELECDRIIGNMGYRPEGALHRELQVKLCSTTEGLAKLAPLLAEDAGNEISPLGPQALLLQEPDFYILGAKSYGRSAKFTISAGLTQIRDLFTIIGDRENLDLYAGMAKMQR